MGSQIVTNVLFLDMLVRMCQTAQNWNELLRKKRCYRKSPKEKYGRSNVIIRWDNIISLNEGFREKKMISSYPFYVQAGFWIFYFTRTSTLKNDWYMALTFFKIIAFWKTQIERFMVFSVNTKRISNHIQKAVGNISINRYSTLYALCDCNKMSHFMPKKS